ncbi:Neutral alpha-glucosidase C, partial [Durusdinium trenchii]
DSVILDFEWFANSSDYAFTEQGEAWYEDFGWNPELFPSPAQQLKTYLLEPWTSSFLSLASESPAWETDSYCTWPRRESGLHLKAVPRLMPKAVGSGSQTQRCRGGTLNRCSSLPICFS